MLPHAYLPKRKIGTGNRFLDPQAPGVWDERDAQLSQLADGIEIPSEGFDQHASAFFVEHSHASDMSLKMAFANELC